MLQPILAVVMPYVVLYITNYVKNINLVDPRLDAVSNVLTNYRVLAIRALVAVLALLGAILTVVVGDMSAEDIDPGLIETAVLSVLNAGIATWVYLKDKK